MRISLLLVTFALAVTATTAGAQDTDLLRQGVVKVVATAGSQSRSAAAGFIVRAEARAVFIVTASHVIEGADRLGIEFVDERRLYPARVLGMEGGDPQGLAALIVENDIPIHVTVLRMNRDLELRPGEPVTMIGFPNAIGVPWAVTKGNIIGRKGTAIVFDGTVEAGNSGGPLVKGDEIVGLITQTQGAYAFAKPSIIVQYALESWGVRFGVRLRSTPAILHESELLPLFREKGFSHPARSVDRIGMVSLYGRTVHEYESATLAGQPVVIDHATGLMWQQSAGRVEEYADPISRHIGKLNADRYAGFGDWRQPTIEELASLMEPRAVDAFGYSRFLDKAFDYGLCHSADRVVVSGGDRLNLGVNFLSGAIYGSQFQATTLCAVRSMTTDEQRRRSAVQPTPN